MLYISTIDNYLEILTDGFYRIKDIIAKTFSETIREEENLRKIAKSFYILLLSYRFNLIDFKSS